MITIEQVIKEVLKETGVDPELVNEICRHPFKCTIDVMKDGEDTKDILFNGLFKFKLKTRFKLNKNKKYTAR